MDKVRPCENLLLAAVIAVLSKKLEVVPVLFGVALRISLPETLFLFLAICAAFWHRRVLGDFVRRNRLYFTVSSLFVLSILLSSLNSHFKGEVFKEGIQVSVYLLLLPFAILSGVDIPRTYIRASKFVLPVLAVLTAIGYTTHRWIRFSFLGFHPNEMAFLTGLFSLLFAFTSPFWIALLSVFFTSLFFSRSAMLALSTSLLMNFPFEIGRRGRAAIRFLTLSLFSASSVFLTPRFLKSVYALQDTLISSVKVEKELVVKSEKAQPQVGVKRIYDMERIWMWKAAVEMWRVSRNFPLLGTGMGTYQHNVKKSCAEGSISEELCSKNIFYIDGHNLLVQILTETGVVGFVTFLILMLYVVWSVRRNRLALTVLVFTLLFSLLQPTPLFTRHEGPMVWLLLFWGGLVKPPEKVPFRG